MARYALDIEYNGQRYSGIQLQQNALSIQAVFENALKVFLGCFIRIHFSGRTDSGVHASSQIISFDYPVQHEHTKKISEASPPERIPKNKMLCALNALLPDDIAVKNVAYVSSSFHSRHSCRARLYEYLIWNRPYPSVFWKDKALWIKRPFLSTELGYMSDELQSIVGEHCFSSFTPKKALLQRRKDALSTLRHIYHVQLSRKVQMYPTYPDESLLSIRICGNAFLQHMVRTIVGTLIDLTQGRLSQSSLKAVMKAQDRNQAGRTMHAKGLYFRKAYYPAGLELLKAGEKPCLALWPHSHSNRSSKTLI